MGEVLPVMDGMVTFLVRRVKYLDSLHTSWAQYSRRTTSRSLYVMGFMRISVLRNIRSASQETGVKRVRLPIGRLWQATLDPMVTRHNME